MIGLCGDSVANGVVTRNCPTCHPIVTAISVKAGPRRRPSVKAASNFSKEEDAQTLRKAMKGFGKAGALQSFNVFFSKLDGPDLVLGVHVRNTYVPPPEWQSLGKTGHVNSLDFFWLEILDEFAEVLSRSDEQIVVHRELHRINCASAASFFVHKCGLLVAWEIPGWMATSHSAFECLLVSMYHLIS